MNARSNRPDEVAIWMFAELDRNGPWTRKLRYAKSPVASATNFRISMKTVIAPSTARYCAGSKISGGIVSCGTGGQNSGASARRATRQDSSKANRAAGGLWTTALAGPRWRIRNQCYVAVVLVL